jgi:hypothetical protein
MKYRYLICEFAVPKGVCRLGVIKNVPNWAQMHQNEPQAGIFPEDACYAMNPDFQKDIKLADVLKNNNTFFVVSERLKDFLCKEDLLAHNEIHPVAIINHKGRPESAKYFLIHQIDDPECIDEDKSKGIKSKLMPDQYAAVTKMVLDEKKIGPEYAIFRAAEYRDRLLIRNDAAEKIEQGGFTGIKFFELKGYDNF